MSGANTVEMRPVDPFAKQAAIYAIYRPTYPPALLSKLLSVLKTPNGQRTCVDIGCGSGQLTLALAQTPHFASVVGVDPSLPQISSAPQTLLQNVKFLQGDAVKLPFPPARFDLATMAQMVRFLVLRVRGGSAGIQPYKYGSSTGCLSPRV